MAARIVPPLGTIDSLLDSVWSGIGVATSSQVPQPFIVAINGHTYLHDLEFKPWKRQAMRATTTETTRTQADTSNEPGEQSLSTEQLWRRTQDSWHYGAGQVFLDRKNSNEFSFRQSKGIDPWTQWQVSLLHDTQKSLTSTNDNLDMCVAGSHLYIIDGQHLKYTSDLVTWTTVTGTPAVTASSICTDGYDVWVAYGADGIYTTTEAASSATQYVTDAVTSSALVRFCLGRLLVGSGNELYNVVASGALPAALLVSDYSNIVWNDAATGNGCIFISGNCGNLGLLYSVQITTDGTALSAPILCGQLPTGELVNAIYGYAGSGLAIGTSLGFRWAEQTLANSISLTVALNIGPLTYLGFGNQPAAGVTCFSGYNRFVWGSYEDFDTGSTGLFRMDPSTFVSDLAPAVASDLMASAQGPITSVVHFEGPSSGGIGTPVFAVQGVGVFSQSANYVASGYVDSGFITYGLADPKMPVFVDVQTNPLVSDSSVGTEVSLDGGQFAQVGVANQTGLTYQEFRATEVLCQTMEIREVLMPDTSLADAPVLTRHTFRAVPAPAAPTDWQVVVQLREKFLIKDNAHFMVPSQEYAYLDNLRINKVISTLQVGNLGPYDVTIETIDWIPEENASLSGELNGVAVITCRTII